MWIFEPPYSSIFCSSPSYFFEIVFLRFLTGGTSEFLNVRDESEGDVDGNGDVDDGGDDGGTVVVVSRWPRLG